MHKKIDHITDTESSDFEIPPVACRCLRWFGTFGCDCVRLNAKKCITGGTLAETLNVCYECMWDQHVLHRAADQIKMISALMLQMLAARIHSEDIV